MDAMNRWAINETLLQSYRSTFISSQSFLLAVGAIVTGKSGVLVYLTAMVGMLVIWFVWFPVVRARHKIVDYYKYSAALDAKSLSRICSEHEYVHDVDRRREANALLGVSTHWRETRVKVDVGSPCSSPRYGWPWWLISAVAPNPSLHPMCHGWLRRPPPAGALQR